LIYKPAQVEKQPIFISWIGAISCFSWKSKRVRHEPTCWGGSPWPMEARTSLSQSMACPSPAFCRLKKLRPP